MSTADDIKRLADEYAGDLVLDRSPYGAIRGTHKQSRKTLFTAIDALASERDAAVKALQDRSAAAKRATAFDTLPDDYEAPHD